MIYPTFMTQAQAVYLAGVENVRVDGKVFQKHLRYIGKEAEIDRAPALLEKKKSIKDGLRKHLAGEAAGWPRRPHDPKSGNKFIKTGTLSKAQEEILKAVDPKLLSRCSV